MYSRSSSQVTRNRKRRCIGLVVMACEAKSQSGGSIMQQHSHTTCVIAFQLNLTGKSILLLITVFQLIADLQSQWVGGHYHQQHPHTKSAIAFQLITVKLDLQRHDHKLLMNPTHRSGTDCWVVSSTNGMYVCTHVRSRNLWSICCCPHVVQRGSGAVT
jgi:hypothetical protein